jgi:hypothetical protein
MWNCNGLGKLLLPEAVPHLPIPHHLIPTALTESHIANAGLAR